MLMFGDDQYFFNDYSIKPLLLMKKTYLFYSLKARQKFKHLFGYSVMAWAFCFNITTSTARSISITIH
jgi:hypothetical protein